MKNNRSLTMSQSLKLYSGVSLPKQALTFSLLMPSFYFATVAVFAITTGLSDGFVQARSEMTETPLNCIYFAITGAVGVMLLMIQTYDKIIPGGKFFRSVKGGFETYRKMKTAMLIAILIGLTGGTGIVCAVNAAFPMMPYPTDTCISTLGFLLLAIGVSGLFSVIRSDIVRVLLILIVDFGLGVSGAVIVYLSKGELGTVHIIVYCLAAVLIPISHKLMLASYRKHRWDN